MNKDVTCKLLLIVAEISMIIGVIATVLLTDWRGLSCEDLYIYKSLVILFSLNGIVLQYEQQKINWED